jgi:hypothetical protein
MSSMRIVPLIITNMYRKLNFKEARVAVRLHRPYRAIYMLRLSTTIPSSTHPNSKWATEERCIPSNSSPIPTFILQFAASRPLHTGILSPLPHLHPRSPPSPASTARPPLPRVRRLDFPRRLHLASASTAASTGTKRVASTAGPVMLGVSSAAPSSIVSRSCRRGGSGQIELVGRQIDGGWLRISTEDDESRFPPAADGLPCSTSLLRCGPLHARSPPW